MPPDRLEAPSPGASASSTTTDRPARARVSAADNHAYPAPMIATSPLFGSATSTGDSRGAASHQYGSWESDADSVFMFFILFVFARQLYDHGARIGSPRSATATRNAHRPPPKTLYPLKPHA